MRQATVTQQVPMLFVVPPFPYRICCPRCAFTAVATEEQRAFNYIANHIASAHGTWPEKNEGK